MVLVLGAGDTAEDSCEAFAEDRSDAGLTLTMALMGSIMTQYKSTISTF